MKKLALIGTIALAVVGTVIFEKGVFTLPTSASPAIVFKDVPSDYWARDAIQTAVDNGYVIGKSEGIFDPESSVTRAEFIKMIVSAEKLPISGQTTGKDWYGPYVNAAVQNGIHAWSDFTSGDWNTPLTRAELARLAVRGTSTDNTDDKKWLYLAAKAGLIQGMDNTGTLAEDGTTTRAQSVTIIERILAVKRGETLPADKHAVSRAEILWHKTNMLTIMPQVFGGEKYAGGQLWDPDNLRLDTPDGKWSGEIDALIAIDLEDPNDPNRGLLPPMSELKWYKSARFPNQMEEIMPAYLVLFQSHVNFNDDTSIYVGNRPDASVSGIDDWESRQAYSTLSGQAGVYRNSVWNNLPAALLPKKLKTRGYASISIKAPAIAPNPSYDKDVLWVKAPEMIE